MRRSSFALLALVAAASAALAGCQRDSADASSSPTATPTVEPSATPTPSASGDASPSPSGEGQAAGDPCADPSVTPVGLPGVEFNRYQQICLGMSFSEATAAMGAQTIQGEDICPWYASIVEFDDPGFYVGAMTRPDNAGEDIYLFRMTWSGDQSAAVAWDAPATEAGITLGSTTAEVQSAYPTAEDVTVDDMSRGPRNQLVVAGPDGTAIVFDVTDGFVTDMYWGTGVSQGAAGELCAL